MADSLEVKDLGLEVLLWWDVIVKPGQSSIKTRDILYRLVISQLFYDGYQQVAVALSNIGKFFIIVIKF